MSNKQDSSNDFTHFLIITVLAIVISMPFIFIAPSAAAVAFMIALVSLNTAIGNKKGKGGKEDGDIDGGTFIDNTVPDNSGPDFSGLDDSTPPLDNTGMTSHHSHASRTD